MARLIARSPEVGSTAGAARAAGITVAAVLAALLGIPAAATAASLTASTAAALRPAAAAADYQGLQEWRFAASAIPIPAGGLRLVRDTAVWTFESGTLRPQRPTSQGVVTGFVFEGRGRFQLGIPDPVELAQLRRAAEKPELLEMDVRFTEMVLRASAGIVAALLPSPATGEYVVSRLARQRFSQWIEIRRVDVDARLIASLLTPGDEYLRAEMHTADYDWLTYEFDGLRREEIQLSRFFPASGFEEVWVSLDRERDARGRPAGGRRDLLDLSRAVIAADLTRPGRHGRQGMGRQQTFEAHFSARLRLEPLVDGLGALQLTLHPFFEVTSVRLARGGDAGAAGAALPLSFLRDHIGGRSLEVDKQVYDSSLVVLLDEPATRGVPLDLVVEYEGDILNYVSGRSWYPGAPERLDDRHSARLELTIPVKHEARASGRRLSEDVVAKTKISVWETERPVTMVAFTVAERIEEETVRLEGVPEVVVFGSPQGFTPRARVRNVGVDVANSANFFQELFGLDLAAARIYVTSIVGGHGQSFDGFIHMSEFTFDGEHPGASELFRAHEVAHQWWGHEVGFATYRDQWLSEAFAEYSGMLFVEQTMKDGRRYYDEIVTVFGEQQRGSLAHGMSKFARPGLLQINEKYRRRIGPIGLGWRAATAETPGAYHTQTYQRGALVLHMLRAMLRDASGNDETFHSLLRDFVARYRGKEATTADFLAVVEAHAGGDWSWFFEQWVEGTAIPRYTWSAKFATAPDAEGTYDVALTVRQSDVPAGFKMPVPVAIELANGDIARTTVGVQRAEEVFHFRVSARPKKAIFNPANAVLARVERD